MAPPSTRDSHPTVTDQDQTRTSHADIEDASNLHTTKRKSPTTRSNRSIVAPRSTASSSGLSSELPGLQRLMDKESECSSCIDGLELRTVADQQHLRAFFGCEAGDSVKGERARERGFVHDDELPGVERGAGGPVGLPPFRRVLRRDAQVLGRTWAAPADSARPTTEPAPCSRSQARRRAFIAVVFPAPAGPTRTPGDAFHRLQADCRARGFVTALQESVLSVEELVGGVDGGVLRSEDGGGIGAAKRGGAGCQFERCQSQRYFLAASTTSPTRASRSWVVANR